MTHTSCCCCFFFTNSFEIENLPDDLHNTRADFATDEEWEISGRRAAEASGVLQWTQTRTKAWENLRLCKTFLEACRVLFAFLARTEHT